MNAAVCCIKNPVDTSSFLNRYVEASWAIREGQATPKYAEALMITKMRSFKHVRDFFFLVGAEGAPPVISMF